VALAAWFAATFAAEEMLAIGVDAPTDPGLPLRSVPVEQATL